MEITYNGYKCHIFARNGEYVTLKVVDEEKFFLSIHINTLCQKAKNNLEKTS